MRALPDRFALVLSADAESQRPSLHAHELGARKIRVNSLNPGLVETEGVHTLGAIGSDFEKQLVADTPLKRVGQPDDIAKVAVFLASDDAGWVTGERLTASEPPAPARRCKFQLGVVAGGAPGGRGASSTTPPSTTLSGVA